MWEVFDVKHRSKLQNEVRVSDRGVFTLSGDAVKGFKTADLLVNKAEQMWAIELHKDTAGLFIISKGKTSRNGNKGYYGRLSSVPFLRYAGISPGKYTGMIDANGKSKRLIFSMPTSGTNGRMGKF